MATQRVSMINSNRTQLNSDYDFSKLRKRLLGNKWGVENKSMFTFNMQSKILNAWGNPANAYVLCYRSASNPIPNQQFIAQFELAWDLIFLNISDWDKIFIEIKENLVADPKLIEDLDKTTNFSQGLWIWEIKVAKNYPTHNNYIKLWEIQGSNAVDVREVISIPVVSEIDQRTTTLESVVSQATTDIASLKEAGAVDHLEESGIVGENTL